MDLIFAALIGAGGAVAAALVASRHTRAIRHQITPANGNTLAAELAQQRHDIAGMAIAVGLHVRDDVRHRGPIRKDPPNAHQA